MIIMMFLIIMIMMIVKVIMKMIVTITITTSMITIAITIMITITITITIRIMIVITTMTTTITITMTMTMTTRIIITVTMTTLCFVPYRTCVHDAFTGERGALNENGGQVEVEGEDGLVFPRIRILELCNRYRFTPSEREMFHLMVVVQGSCDSHVLVSTGTHMHVRKFMSPNNSVCQEILFI